MADLAHDGRTVIVVTHSVANLDLCDRLLVLVPGGKVAYFGPPTDGLRHFGKPGWAEVFQAFDDEPEPGLGGRFPALGLLPAVRSLRHGGRRRRHRAPAEARPRPRSRAISSPRPRRWSGATWRCSARTRCS